MSDMSDTSEMQNAVLEPHTRSTLLRSTLIAAGVAALLLVTVVMPAEYGVDPTGIGGVLGLQRMGEIKMQLAREAEAEDAAAAIAEVTPATPEVAAVADPAAADSGTARSDETSVTLAPGEGTEIKLAMNQGARVTYSWSSAGGAVNYDLHGDSENPPRSYHGYEKASGVASDDGVLEAAFTGSHGWFWRNRGRQNVTVTLRTSGEYTDIKRLD